MHVIHSFKIQLKKKTAEKHRQLMPFGAMFGFNTRFIVMSTVLTQIRQLNWEQSNLGSHY